ncbi:MAG: hypothetical protein JNJ41_08620 [Bacteroidia bacterium]|nr:hypothetical protein [Bacteroidia bacterium]
MIKLFLKNPLKFISTRVSSLVQNQRAFSKAHAATSVLQNNFISKLSRYKINWDDSKKSVVLVQSVSDYQMCIKIAAASHQLATEKKANIAYYSAEHETYFYNSQLNSLSTKNFKTTLDKIFLSFAGKLIYRNNHLFHDQQKINTLVAKIIDQTKNKQDVLNIEIENIKLGDLIYDTYLRYADKPELDLRDPFFKILIAQTCNIFYVSKQKIEEFNIVSLVSSYTTYIYHGIAVRICLQKNIPVYTVGAYYSLVHKVLKEYPSHANDHFLFNKLFQKLENKNKIIETHKAIFEKRFEGVIDSATSYMKQSAFSADTNKELETIDWPNTVVVLAHCFFDSPHIYRDLLFPDFYDWMNFTLDELSKQKDLTILVKQHPNGLPANDPLFEVLKKKYAGTKILFIDKKTSQMQIINSRPKAIVTAYGTAAAEFSYEGFPVLTIYDNPFTAYDFTHLANSVNEYKELLQNVKNLPSKQNREQIIEYYYMQYFFFLKGKEIDYLMCAKYKGQTFSDTFLQDYLPNMTPTYFEMLDAAIKDGFLMCDWEAKALA